MGFKALAVAVGTTDTVLFECPATYDGSAHGIVFGNVTASAVTITIKLYDHSEGGSKTLIAGKSIAANSEYTFPKPINLNAGDKIIALASSASAVTALVSAYIATAAPAAVGITPRGDYSSTAQYAVNDAVYDPATETTYLALAANTASPPPSADWMVLAKRGEAGTAGQDGADGADSDVFLNAANVFTALQTFSAGTRSKHVALGTGSAIDLALGDVFSKTISGATTFTLSNVAASGLVSAFILELNNGGSASVTLWSGIKWAGGTAPTLTTSGVDLLGFITRDGGTTWRGFVLAKDSK